MPSSSSSSSLSPNGQTLAVYARLAPTYAARTVDLDTRAHRAWLTQRLQPGAHILDAGCGWGRDARAFLNEGFQVTAFDGCPAMSALAAQHLSQPVATLRFQDFDVRAQFDAVWARASLLHLDPTELSDALARLVRALRPGGWLFASFKHGESERVDEQGRYFNDMTVERFDPLLAATGTGACRVLAIESEDAFGRAPGWLNLLVRAAGTPSSPNLR